MYKNLFKLFKSLPFQLFLSIVFAYTCGSFLSIQVISIAYTVSCFLKSVLMLLLPLIVFGYIFSAIIGLEKNAPLLILLIIALVTLSNAITSFSSFGVGSAILPYLKITKGEVINFSNLVEPYFDFNFKAFISTDKAMVIGVVLGIVLSFYKTSRINKITKILQKFIVIFFEKGFIPLLPFYVLGFVLKMQYEGTLGMLFKNYAQVFAVICITLILYLSLLYFIASSFSISEFVRITKNMISPMLTGFSSISSAVTMPLTINSTVMNIKDEQYTKLVIPTTVNIHMIGHGISIPITALSILLLFGQDIPSVQNFALFVFYFCLAKFSASAVPGGGIIVILPILQSYLNFTPQMCSIIVMLDILQDAFLTSANVLGNGAFAIISNKIYKCLFKNR